MHPVYVVAILAATFCLGGIFFPQVARLYAEAKTKVETKYSTQIASLQSDLSKAKSDVDAVATKVKNDADAAYTAMKTRAEAAESDLAALKRFLPGVTAAAPAPVVASAPAPSPAVGAAAAAPVTSS